MIPYMSKPPVPATKRALLWSERFQRWSWHAYVDTQPCVLPGPDGEAWEFLYTCEESGLVRRWGVQDRLPNEAN